MFLLTMGAWWSSSIWSDGFMTPGGTALISENGYLVFFLRTDPQSPISGPVGFSREKAMRIDFTEAPLVRCPLYWSDTTLNLLYYYFAPTRFAGTSIDSSPYTYREFHLSHAVLSSVSAIPYFAALLHKFFKRRQKAAGLCPACGYDLRATPERCPECGKGAT
jgi:hypothetical protein